MNVNEVPAATKAVVAADLLRTVKGAITLAQCRTVLEVQTLLDGMIEGADDAVRRG